METFFIYTLGITLLVFMLYFLGISVAPFSPNKVKNDHFECGLPASSHVPKKANFSFFVYAVMFIIADMTGLFFTLFVYASSRHAQLLAAVFALILAAAFFIAMRELHHKESSC